MLRFPTATPPSSPVGSAIATRSDVLLMDEPLSNLDALLRMEMRAENIEVVPEAGPGLVPAKVLVLEPLGAHNLLTVQSGDDTLRVTTRADLFPAPDSEIWLRIEPTRVRWMDRETRTALD